MSLLTLEASIKSHLVAIVTVAILIAGSVYGVNSLIEKHDEKNDAKWAAIIAQNDAKYKADETNLQQTLATALAQNATLSAQMSQRDLALAQVTKAIASAPASQIAKEIGGTSVDNTTVSLPIDTARAIDTQLAMLPVVEANLADETTKFDNDEKIIAADKLVISDLQTKLSVYEPVDKPCQAQIKTIKANARKSKLKWFAIGFVAGRISAYFFPGPQAIVSK